MPGPTTVPEANHTRLASWSSAWALSPKNRKPTRQRKTDLKNGWLRPAQTLRSSAVVQAGHGAQHAVTDAQLQYRGPLLTLPCETQMAPALSGKTRQHKRINPADQPTAQLPIHRTNHTVQTGPRQRSSRPVPASQSPCSVRPILQSRRLQPASQTHWPTAPRAAWPVQLPLPERTAAGRPRPVA